jgi:hypothetical protein
LKKLWPIEHTRRCAGIASFQGESRTRIAGVVLASIGMALSTFIGATMAATSGWLLVPIVAIAGSLY